VGFSSTLKFLANCFDAKLSILLGDSTHTGCLKSKESLKTEKPEANPIQAKINPFKPQKVKISRDSPFKYSEQYFHQVKIT
jgi:hypothetical protein